MRTVLVTGATGFIGRCALEPLVRRGYAVHAITRNGANSALSAGVQWHELDLLARDRTAMEALIAELRPTDLLHFAWNAKHGEFWSTPENLSWIAASLELVRCFADHGGRRFVGAGTCAEYEWSGGECREGDTPLRPATLYGTAKKVFFEALAAFAGEVELSWAWGRIFLLFGPEEQEARLVPHLIRSALLRQPASCRFGQLQRDFLHVADVADAFAALLASEVEGAVNVASGTARPLGEMVERISQCCDGGEVLTVERQQPGPGEPLVLAANVDRLRNEVGWVPGQSLDAAVEATVSWWRQALEARAGRDGG